MSGRISWICWLRSGGWADPPTLPRGHGETLERIVGEVVRRVAHQVGAERGEGVDLGRRDHPGTARVRGLARVRLANLSHVCSTYRQSGPNRGREKAYYENARQAHYERFGPRAYYKSGRRQHSS